MCVAGYLITIFIDPVTWPLEIYPRSGSSTGGYELIVSGPCLEQDDVITCTFDDVIVDGYVLDSVRAACIVPVTFVVGQVPLIVNINDWEYQTELNLGKLP